MSIKKTQNLTLILNSLKKLHKNNAKKVISEKWSFRLLLQCANVFGL
jgi:hypothetical protein